MNNYKILTRPEVGKFYKYENKFIVVVKDVNNKYYIIEDDISLKDFPLQYLEEGATNIDEIMRKYVDIFVKLGMMKKTVVYKPGDRFRLKGFDYCYTIISIDEGYTFINQEFEAGDRYDTIDDLVKNEFPSEKYESCSH